MGIPLKLLLVEDSESDASLLIRQLSRAGYTIEHERVDTAAGMLAALEHQAWDLVISDYEMPAFSGPEALKLFNAAGLKIPFIVLSGAVGEETVVKMMKLGASDYVMKGKLTRLVPVIEREIRDARIRAERAEIEKNLVYERSLLQILLENLPDRLYFKDREGRFTRLSKSQAEFLGLEDPAQALGKTDFDFFVEKNARRSWITEQKIIATGKAVVNIEEETTTASGQVSWVNTTKMPLFDSDGKLAGTIGLSSDITERKRTDTLIKTRMHLLEYASTHSLYEILVETLDVVGEITASPIGFYHFVDPDQKTLTLQAWSTRTSQEFCKAEGKGLHYNIDQAGIWVDAILQQRPVIHNDYASLPGRKGLPEGHAAVLRELVVPIFRNGAVVAILGVGNKPLEYSEQDKQTVNYLADIAWEIVTRKRAEEAIRENEARYRAVAESAHDAIITVNSAGIISGWNSGAADIFGWDANEAVGQPLALIIPDELNAIRLNEMLQLNQGGTPHPFAKTVEMKGQRKGQRIFPLELSMAEWQTSQGKFYTAIARDITQRKQTEESLQVRIAAIEAADNAIVILNLEGNIQWINQAFTKLTGYTFTDVMGKNLEILRSGKHEPAFYDRLWETVRAGHVWQGELINRRKNGTLYHEEMSLTPVGDAEGKITRFIAIKKDISGRKFAEEALIEEKERFRSLYEDVPVGIYRTTPAGQILDANPALVRMLGFDSFEELARLNLENDGYSEGYSRADFKQEIVRQGHIQGYESGMKRKDGSTIFVRENAHVVLDPEGRPLYYEGTLEDITAIRHSELQNMRLAAAIEHAGETVILTDRSGLIQYANPAFTEMFGFAAGGVTGKNVLIFSNPYQDQQTWAAILALPLSGQIWHGDIRTNHADGRWLEIETTISPVLGPNRAVSSLVFVMHNVTQERKNEIQRRQSQKLEAIGHLAAGIAHEINTPTQFIGNNLRFLQNGFQDLARLVGEYEQTLQNAESCPEIQSTKEKIAELANTIDLEFLKEEIPAAIEGSLKGIDRVTRIVSAMKEFSHPAAHEKIAADINHAIENTLVVSHNAWKYVADLKTDLDPGLPAIPCLVDEFNQVMLNLISNAADAIREAKERNPDGQKGLISISTRQAENWIVVKVSDNGTGIPAAIRERIFDPFFTTKEVGKGSGQGLPISYDVIVNKHGGKISFETEVGQGTTFIVQLPVGAEQSAPRPA